MCKATAGIDGRPFLGWWHFRVGGGVDELTVGWYGDATNGPVDAVVTALDAVYRFGDIMGDAHLRDRDGPQKTAQVGM